MSELDPAFVDRVLGACDPDGDPSEAMVLADAFLERGDAKRAARALDRAFGLAPADRAIAAQRRALFDSLAIEEHGLRFRFVPAGPFLMGAEDEDPDSRPVHVATTGAFWIAEVPMTWTDHGRLFGMDPDEGGRPDHELRRRFCPEKTSPMVAVAWQSVEALCAPLGWRLPSEAEWEKAARGGLVGARWAWGNEPPDPSRCDFDHAHEPRIRDPRALPPNGYGVHAMCGTVWEWTRDLYDALAYRGERAKEIPEGQGERVLRGGSWSDVAEACTVAFRMSRAQENGWPNIGYRVIRPDSA